jgi:hypothetical protein
VKRGPKPKNPVPDPTPAEPVAESVKVAVDPAIASDGTESFNDGGGLGLFAPKASGNEEASSGKPLANPVLLSYPFVKLFQFADKLRGTEGVLSSPDWPEPHGVWELSAEEKEYFVALSEELMKMMKNVKYVRLAIVMGGIIVMVLTKATTDVEYHKRNPHAAPEKVDKNPADPTGRKGARK